MAPRAALACFTLSIACAAPGGDFEREALPVLEQRCFSAACHGVGPDDAMPSDPGLFVRVGADGRVVDVTEAREAALARVSVVAPRGSTLVRVPMPDWAGGGPHAGGGAYTGPDDPGVRRLLAWIATEAVGGEDVELSPSSSSSPTR